MESPVEAVLLHVAAVPAACVFRTELRSAGPIGQQHLLSALHVVAHLASSLHLALAPRGYLCRSGFAVDALVMLGEKLLE